MFGDGSGFSNVPFLNKCALLPSTPPLHFRYTTDAQPLAKNIRTLFGPYDFYNFLPYEKRNCFHLRLTFSPSFTASTSSSLFIKVIDHICRYIY